MYCLLIFSLLDPNTILISFLFTNPYNLSYSLTIILTHSLYSSIEFSLLMKNSINLTNFMKKLII